MYVIVMYTVIGCDAVQFYKELQTFRRNLVIVLSYIGFKKERQVPKTAWHQPDHKASLPSIP